MKHIITYIKYIAFKMKLRKGAKLAEKSYKDKQGTVICKYCGKLLSKNDAGMSYDIDTKEVKFFCIDCFMKDKQISESLKNELLKGE